MVDLRLELVLIPVSDVDRAKTFYAEKAGFKLDLDHRVGEEFRVVQLTPPGSPCSISVGTGITDAVPGSARGMHLVVSDIEAARAELVERGVDVGEVQHTSSRASGYRERARNAAPTVRSPSSVTPTATAGSSRSAGEVSGGPERHRAGCIKEQGVL